MINIFKKMEEKIGKMDENIHFITELEHTKIYQMDSLEIQNIIPKS